MTTYIQLLIEKIKANWKPLLMIAAAILIAAVLYIGVTNIIDTVHNWIYASRQAQGDKVTGQHEANSNTAEANANVNANNLKGLEENENKIIQQQNDSNNRLANDAQQSADTRQQLDDILNKSLPDRNTNPATDDDSLRTDAERANEAFNARRSKKPTTRKP